MLFISQEIALLLLRSSNSSREWIKQKQPGDSSHTGDSSKQGWIRVGSFLRAIGVKWKKLFYLLRLPSQFAGEGSSGWDAEAPCSSSCDHWVAAEKHNRLRLNNRKQKMRKLHRRAALNKDISADNNCTLCVWGVYVFIIVNVHDQTSLFWTFTKFTMK